MKTSTNHKFCQPPISKNAIFENLKFYRPPVRKTFPGPPGNFNITIKNFVVISQLQVVTI